MGTMAGPVFCAKRSDVTTRHQSRFLVDAHVHLHRCFDDAVVLDDARTNFERGAARLGDGRGGVGWLLLAEATGEDAFARLRARGASGRWAIRPTAEACSLLAEHEDGALLVLVAGRQIVSAEGIEVLALGTTAPQPDGRLLADTLCAVRVAGALPVLPWGFGKWLGRRGRLVEAQIRRAHPGQLFLGDNGGRPAWSRRPRLFRLAEARGIAVLPGSDPLPLPQEISKVARYGLVAEVPFDHEAPFAPLRRYLRELDGSPRSFGALERLAPFLHRQVAMQIRKRRGAR